MVAHTSRRKRKTTSTTSTTLIMSEISTSCTLERMVVVRSTATSILMVGGMAACRRGISAITLSTVEITLAPGILKTMSRTALFSFARRASDRIDARHAGGVDVGDAVDDRAQVGDAHRRAGLLVVAGDDGRIVAGLENLVVVADLPAMVRVLKGALGPVGVGVGQRGAHRLQADAVRAQLHGVQLDAHRRAGAAADKNLAHALDLRDLLRQDGVGHVVDLRLGHHIGGQRENQDGRFGGVGLAVAWDSAAGKRATGCAPR